MMNLVDRFHKETKHIEGDTWCSIHCDAKKVSWLVNDTGNLRDRPEHLQRH